MAAKRVFRSALDWSKFSEIVPKDAAADATYKSLKHTSDSLVSKVATLPESLPELDWNYYKSRLPAMVSMVDNFEQKYKALKVDYPKAPSDLLSKIDANEKAYAAAVEKMKGDIEEQQKTIKVELARLEKMPPIEQMTDDDWLINYPEYTYDPRVRPAISTNIGDLHDDHPDEDLVHLRQYGIRVPHAH